MTDETPIIDAHTHVHATREAAHTFLDLLNPELSKAQRAGSIDESSELMLRLGISSTLILPWVFAQEIYRRAVASRPSMRDEESEATRDQIAADWAAYNSWAIAQRAEQPGRFAAMCAVDPILLGEARTRAQIERGLAEGAIGLKIVPGFMDAYPDDPRMAVVWEEADRRRLPVTAQCSGASFAHPSRFEAVLRDYPNCRVVLAHMGLGGGEDEVVRLAGTYPNVFADTSSWLGNVGKPGERNAEEAVKLFRRIGTDRVIFGTNYPITDPAEFVHTLRGLPLTASERRLISFENAQRVYPGLGA